MNKFSKTEVVGDQIMKRTSKNSKKGFTLVEMVLVIFIILVMSAVLLYGITSLIDYSRNSTEKVSTHISSVDHAAEDVDNLLV